MSRTDRRLIAEASVPLPGDGMPRSAPRLRGRTARLLVAAAAAVALAALVAHWLAQRWSHVAIDDARVAGSLVTVSSEVGGRVDAVRVVVGDTVAKGDLLVAIDPGEAELELQGLEAQIAGLAAHQDQLRAQQQMIRTQVASSLAAGRAQIAAAEANHKASEAALRNAESRFDRVSALASRQVVAAQDLDAAREERDTVRQQELATAAAIQVARANLAVSQAEEGQIAILDRQIATLDAEASALAAQRDRARLDVSHHEMRAAFDGVIDSTFVDIGEYVSPGTRLLI
jgi:membrane fusion protein (multidrug efflux system)